MKKNIKRTPITLATYLTTAMCLLVFAASAIVAYFSFEILKTSKIKDRWVIYFLQMNDETDRIYDKLTENKIKLGLLNDPLTMAQPKAPAKPDALFKIVGNRLKLVRGKSVSFRSMKDLGVRNPRYIRGHFIAQDNGTNYYAEKELKPNGDLYLKLWKTDLHKWVIKAQAQNKDATIYLINKQGKLIYANRPGITAGNLTKRKLVQYFIATPMNQGQLYFRKDFGFKEFGFFSRVKNSNLFLLAEVPYTVVLDRILDLVKKFVGIVILVFVATLILVQFPIRKISRPLKEMILATESIGKGNFKISLKTRTYGELALLADAFQGMAQSLVVRDKEIEGLLVERAHKAVLEQELKIAQDIQSNFLPTQKGQEAPGIHTDFVYIPAGECAGDWFAKFECPATGEFVVAIADVSGHGTGSSMFTAIIASIFIDTQFDIDPETGFNPDVFFGRVNRTFLSIGKTQWHASAQVIKINKERTKATVSNAGHVFPFIVPAGEGRKVKRVVVPGSVLGLDKDIQTSVKEIPLSPQCTLMLMTDGLIETRDHDRREFGLKRLRTLLEKEIDNSPTNLVENIVIETNSWRGDGEVEDDSCIIGVRVG